MHRSSVLRGTAQVVAECGTPRVSKHQLVVARCQELIGEHQATEFLPATQMCFDKAYEIVELISSNGMSAPCVRYLTQRITQELYAAGEYSTTFCKVSRRIGHGRSLHVSPHTPPPQYLPARWVCLWCPGSSPATRVVTRRVPGSAGPGHSGHPEPPAHGATGPWALVAVLGMVPLSSGAGCGGYAVDSAVWKVMRPSTFCRI